MPAASFKRFDGLDAIRGLAAVSVACCHTILIGGVQEWPSIAAVAHNLTLAVPMFFMLSAFVLAAKYQDTLGEFHELRLYAVRRFMRIAPLFYTMMLAWLIYRYLFWHRLGTGAEIALNVSFLYGFSDEFRTSIVPAGWSIGVEMIFYAILPFMLAVVRNLRAALIFTLVSLALGSVLFTYRINDDVPARMTFLGNGIYFAAGFTAFHVYQRCRTVSPDRAYAISAGCFVVGFSIWLLAFCTSKHFGDVGLSYPWRILVSSSFPLFIVGAALVDWKWLVNKVTVRLGALSYSIYLTHVLVIKLEKPFQDYLAANARREVAMLLSVIGVVAGAIALASITYKFVEQPGIRLGSALLARRRRTLVPAE